MVGERQGFGEDVRSPSRRAPRARRGPARPGRRRTRPRRPGGRARRARRPTAVGWQLGERRPLQGEHPRPVGLAAVLVDPHAAEAEGGAGPGDGVADLLGHVDSAPVGRAGRRRGGRTTSSASAHSSSTSTRSAAIVDALGEVDGRREQLCGALVVEAPAATAEPRPGNPRWPRRRRPSTARRPPARGGPDGPLPPARHRAGSDRGRADVGLHRLARREHRHRGLPHEIVGERPTAAARDRSGRARRRASSAAHDVGRVAADDRRRSRRSSPPCRGWRRAPARRGARATARRGVAR